MKTYLFNTNLSCASCEAKLRKELHKEPLIKQIDVDLTKAEKVVKITAESPLDEHEIMALIKTAGFNAQPKTAGMLKQLFSFF